jgi:hypothetical protein
LSQKLFVLGDADQVRRRIEALLFAGNLEELGRLSRKIGDAIQAFGARAQSSMKAHVVFAGGDELLFLVSSSLYSEATVYELISEFQLATSLSISVGVGNSAEEAYLNLARAKAMGPGSLRADQVLPRSLSE